MSPPGGSSALLAGFGVTLVVLVFAVSASVSWFLLMSFQNNLKPPEAKRKIQHVTWP